MSKKIFVVVLSMSGTGYDVDNPYILGALSTRALAENCMEKAYKEYTEDGKKETIRHPGDIEETNFDEDYHLVIKIVEREIDCYE